MTGSGPLLAFDTATPATTVALLAAQDAAEGLGEGVTAFGGVSLMEARHDPEPGERPQHAGRLLALAAELLDDAGLTFADLDRIAVGTGPGTFTGLRIGIATARALAQGTGAELVGVSTLRALAAAAQGATPEGAPSAAGAAPVLAVLDARRGEAFVAAWRGDEELIAPAAVTPALLGTLVARAVEGSGSSLAVGDGAVRFREVLEPSGVTVPADGSPLHRVSALSVALLAAGAPPTGRDVVPEYLRLPDAEIALRKRRAE